MASTCRRCVLGAIAAAAGAALSFIACNQISGLSDFDKVDCVGAGCDPPDAGRPDVIVPDVAIDVQPDVDVIDAPVDTPLPDAKSELGDLPLLRRWARWHMPNYPSVHGVDGGLDANFDVIHPPTYDEGGVVDGGHGVVHDTVTNLYWTDLQQGQTVTIEDAKGQCEAIPPQGSCQWTLPSRIELVSLLDPTQVPTIDPTFFPDVVAGEYWTASRGAEPADLWIVDFSSGVVRTTTSTSDRSYLCVCVP